MNVVDVAMVGRVSDTALASVAAGNVYLFSILIFCIGLLLVLDPLIAQAVGAGDRDDVALHLQRGLWLACALSLPAVLFALPAGPLLRLLKQQEEVVPIAAGYVHASIPGILPFLAALPLRQTLQALSRTRAIVWTVLFANAVNVVLDLAWIHGWFGFTASGAVGCAWATSVCRGLLVVGLLTLGWRELRPHLRPLRPAARDIGGIWRMLVRGAPLGGAHLLEYGAFMATTLMMGHISTQAGAGHQVAIILASLSFMVPLGVSSAAAVRVGYAVGRGDAPGARVAAALPLAGTVLIMSLFAALFLGAPRALATIYTDESEVLAVAAALIPLAGVFQLADGLQVVASGVLRGLGDVRTPLLVHLLGFWVIGLPLGAFLSFGCDVGVTGPWWGLVAGLSVGATILTVRVPLLLRQQISRLPA